MLYLLFDLGNDAYALETSSVIGVLPLDDIERVAQAAPHIAGTVDYRSERVPVIDLCVLALGRSAERRFSTRVILLNRDARDRSYVLGVVVERATRTTRSEPGDFTPAKRDVGELLTRSGADSAPFAAGR